jgi:DNA-binding transcriptional regulator YiaG
MASHPNRGRPSGASNPAPEAIKTFRLSLGLSQTAFGALVHAGLRTVQDWEAGERRMHPGLWELAQIKGQPPA